MFILSSAALILFVIQLELLLVAAFLITFGEYNIIKVNPNIHDIYVMVTAALLIAFPAIIYETVHQWKQSKQTSAASTATSKSKQIVVRSKGKNVVIPCDQILFMESFGDIIKIKSGSAKEAISTRMSLTKMEDELPHFIRIHRSYLVNPNQITSYTHELVYLNGHELPVGRTYKQGFIRQMEEKSFKF